MHPLFARLRDALPAPYDVERLLASGGMSHVFVGRDRRLDRRVAIKVLRPELATARGAERFLREARTAARLSHPNLLPVFDVGEAGGLYYMVLALADGPTLADRLRSGALEEPEVTRIARDLLDALAAIHAEGVVHRDVKPSNVFLAEGRAVLGDFGIAVEDDPRAEALTRTGETVGTPAYLAPELAAGRPATPRSDVYAAGIVLFEAATGRRWSSIDDPTHAALAEAPADLRPALAGALARRPEDRWSDGGAFRDALANGEGRRRFRPRVAVVLLLALGGLGVWWLLGRPAPGGSASADELSDLVLLPCETVPAADSVLGRDVVRLAILDLQGLPNLRVTRAQTTFAWWQAVRLADDGRDDPLARVHRSRYAARCTLLREAGGLEARLELEDERGATVAARVVRGPDTDPPVSLGDSVAVALIRSLEGTRLPSGILSGGGSDALSGRPFPAIRAFLRGEEAFQRSAWNRAEEAYRDALRIDPGFALATWRLVDVHRWRREPVGFDLERLHAEGRDRLGPLDRRLLEARLAPEGPQKHALYEAILADHPTDAYAILLYGDELLHRGPLFGVPIDSAVTVLRRSAARDSFFSPTFDHLAQAEIRLGREEEARRTVDLLFRTAAPPGEVDLHMPTVLRHVWVERFRPAEADSLREALVAAAARRDGERRFLADYARLAGPYYDLPDAGHAFGRRLASLGPGPGTGRIEGQVTAGIALVSLGRTVEALALFDSAAAASGQAEGRLQTAEWRVLPAALGLTGPPADEVARGRADLAGLAGDAGQDPVRRLRAASALALLAGRQGDTAAAARWRGVVDGLPPGTAGRERQLRLLEAAGRAGAGRPEEALRISAPLLTADSVGHLHRPFERASVALLRAEWQMSAGDPGAAEASWRWHENSDLELPHAIGGTPRFAQAGEVDWALGTEPRVRAASAALAAGRSAAACRLAGEATRRLAEADAPFGPVREEARALARAVCAP